MKSVGSAYLLAACLVLRGAFAADHPGYREGHASADGYFTAAGAPASQTLKLTLTGPQGQQAVIDPHQLAALERKTITVHNGHTGMEETYEGVPLVALLAKVGAPGRPMGKAASLYVVAEGSDHYRIVLSLTEVMPAFHPGDVLVADHLNGQPLTKDGPLKLIVSEDKQPERWVRNLVSITLVQAP